jgi:membrane dipeptidase
MMALSFVVDPDAPTLSRWLDHFDHAVAVMGIEHVGLGADFVDQVTPTEQGLGLDEAPPSEMAQVAKSRFSLDDFTGPENFPSLVTALRARGYDGQRLEAIMSANWLTILREALPA